MKKLDCIVVIGEDRISGLIIERIIQVNELAKQTKFFTDAEDAIEHFIALVEGSIPWTKFPDLVLIDSNMSGMKNYTEIIEAIRELALPKVVFFCVCSNSVTWIEEQKIKQMGIFYQLNQPVKKEQLIEVILKMP